MMRNLLLLLACILFLVAKPLRADDTNLILRLFPVELHYFTGDPPIQQQGTDDDPANLKPLPSGTKEFYQKYGITFPEDAYVTYDLHARLLHHYNTEKNQKLLGELFNYIDPRPSQVRLDALFVDFSIDEIETLARANTSPFPRSEDILKLWKDGKGTLLHALNLITQSGVNAQVQAVSEYIYAMEFREVSTNNTQSPLPVPDRFNTREAGAIFNVTPTVRHDRKTIDVVMAPELTSKPEWTHSSVTATYAGGEEIQLSVPQPLFHSRNITTSFVMTDQSTQVFGGMENPAGDGVTYLFLTVTLIDASGQPLKDYAGDTPP